MPKAINGYKICSKCREKKPVSKFHRDETAPDGLNYQCRACMKAYYGKNRAEMLSQQRAYYEENREERPAQHRAYSVTTKGKQVHRQAGRRRRALKYKAEGFHTYTEFIELCKALDFRCQGCGEIFFLNWLEEDHIVPLSRGGDDSIDNIQPLCKSCNSSKSDKMIEEWIACWIDSNEEEVRECIQGCSHCRHTRGKQRSTLAPGHTNP